MVYLTEILAEHFGDSYEPTTAEATNHQPEIGYGKAAGFYVERGWTPIPLYGKRPAQAGITGANGCVSASTIADMRQQFYHANTGILADHLAVIDVDDYDGKTGNAELLELEAELGKLPTTFYSTSRGADSTSRQLFFRRNTNEPLNGDPTPNIEVIWRGYRLSMVAPSVHPVSGVQVQWFDGDSKLEVALPSVDALPYLPQAWEEFLARPRAEYDRGSIFTGELTEWETWLDDSEPTYFAQELLDTIQQRKHIGHFELLGFLREIHRLRSDLWERGLRHCLSALKNRYAATSNETSATQETELQNALRWVIGETWAAGPVFATSAREIALALQMNAPSPSTDFWQSRESLQAIYKIGRQTLLAPTSLLGICIARALHTVPFNVHYRSYLGSAPLNTLVAITGPTGTGKTQSMHAVNEYLIFPDADDRFSSSHTWSGPVSPGSGEAMPDAYMKQVKKSDGAGNTHWAYDWKHPNHAVIFGFDEIGMLEKRAGRDGSTMTEFLKQGYSGSEFGRALSNGKGIELKSKTYRFSAIINAQPERSGLIFTPEAVAGGFSSRFLFMSTQDKNAQRERDRSQIGPFYFRPINWQGVEEFKGLDCMNEAHEIQALAAVDGGIDPEVSHQLLTRAKCAVALAVLEGRTYLVQEDWDLSDFVIKHSDDTRKVIKSALVKASARENDARGKAAGVKAAIAAEVQETTKSERMINHIMKTRMKNPGITDGAIRRALNVARRPDFDEAIELLNEGEKPNPEGSK